MSADPYLELATLFTRALKSVLPPIDFEQEVLTWDETQEEVARYLREGNSVVALVAGPCGCDLIVRSYVRHGNVMHVRYHEASCSSQLGCSCGCYEELADNFLTYLVGGLHGPSPVPVHLLDGIPNEAGKKPNRAQRRATVRRRCR